MKLPKTKGPLFIYKKNTGEKLTYSVTGDKELTIATGFTVIENYEYEYIMESIPIKIGKFPGSWI